MNTLELKLKLRNKTREEQNIILKDSCKGEKCFVFSCGPSLISRESFDKYVLNKDYKIATVKQAFYRMADQVDFHFFNLCNFTPFQKKTDTVFFASSDMKEDKARNCVWGDQEIDVVDVVDQAYNCQQMDKTLVNTKDFESAKFDHTITRPCGPGIMHESVFYHLLHMGFSEIIVNGYDMSSPKTGRNSLPHFYNKEGEVGGLNFFKNKAAIPFNDEIKNTVESSWDLFQFFQKNKMTLKLVSAESHLDARIPRIQLKDL